MAAVLLSLAKVTLEGQHQTTMSDVSKCAQRCLLSTYCAHWGKQPRAMPQGGWYLDPAKGEQLGDQWGEGKWDAGKSPQTWPSRTRAGEECQKGGTRAGGGAPS